MLCQCWASVADDGPTLKQPWVNASCKLGCVLLNLQCLCNTPPPPPPTVQYVYVIQIVQTGAFLAVDLAYLYCLPMQT